MLISKLNHFNPNLLYLSHRYTSTNALVNYNPQTKIINVTNKSELTKKMINFFKQNPVDPHKDLSFFVNNEIIIDITVQKNFKKNMHEHCIYFQVSDKGISSYKKIMKTISKTQTNLKCEYKPAHGIIRIYSEIQLQKINGKQYLPLNKAYPKLFFEQQLLT